VNRSLRQPAVLAIAALFVLFLAARVALLLGGKVFTAPDSWVYAPQEDPARNLGPLVSFIGNAPRPWGLPAFYALFPDDAARTVGQWVVGTIAWAAFAWEISRLMRSSIARFLACAALLTLGAMNTVASWDFAILTESMSISLGLIAITLFIRWFRLGKVGYLAGAVLVTIWWTFIRPDIRLFTMVLIALLGLYGIRLVRRGESLLRGRPLQAAVASVLLIGSLGWYAAITPSMMERFKAYDGDALPVNPLSLDEELFVHRLRVITFTDPALLQVFHTDLGMPSCPDTERFATRSDWATVEFAQAYVGCPDMVAWGKEHDHDFWGTLAAANPQAFSSKVLELTSYTLGGQVYASAPQVVPAVAERMMFPSRQYGLPIALAGIGLATALALVVGARRRHRFALSTGVLLGGTAIASAGAAVILGTGEFARFGIQETVASRLAVIILVCVALDLLVERRTPTPAPQTENEPEAVSSAAG